MSEISPTTELPLIEPAQLAQWVMAQSADIIVVNKPGWVVCHPSKRGPWSSLVGALREHLGTPTLHLVTRLDRETSGVVVVARNPAAARQYQMAMQERRVEKTYLALLAGEMREAATVDAPIARDENSAVAVKRRAARADEPGAESAQTRFMPLLAKNGFTLARVEPLTGRTHQIRVHAAHLGHAIVGDKLYGPDASLYLEFAQTGWTPRHAAMLPIRRQALHAARLRFLGEGLGDFSAPPPADLAEFARTRMGIELTEAWRTQPDSAAMEKR
ncbi:MAG TPA: RNA pseudouridine synthase [Opitutales bacterium]|nr:RNA pseudouridine synthase [Opitutales bacterium]